MQAMKVRDTFKQIEIQPELAQDNQLDDLAFQIESLLFWDGMNPEYLGLSATHYALKGAASENVSDAVYQDYAESAFGEAINATKAAQYISPLNYTALIQHAESLWRMGKPFDVINQPISLAQKVAPFDTKVALFSLEFLLAHWPQLSASEKVLASRYLLKPIQYRINYHQLNEVVARSPEKERACRLLGFANQAKTSQANMNNTKHKNKGVRLKTCKGVGRG
ncbi:hypothetical protein [Photobacterium sp. BZF1]|uniref:hypothetical protein n=1 Tax=Photobacterium sp. BZF1 TaxID=1904457 RepID=UPI001CA41A86|nr:hypothetical protein [Photobacterium sp. BZF1]